MLNVTQCLYGEVLLRFEPTLCYPEGFAEVTSVRLRFLLNLVDPGVGRERV